VQVGQLSSEAALSGEPPSWLVQLGIAATLAAVVLIGNLASKTLKELDIDLED
jgi:tetrahydromethanopterin S-methyltransferase subunit E